MKMEKGLIIIAVVLGCTSYLFGDNKNITSNKMNNLSTTSKKVYAKISGDVERPLLRPVVNKKEDTISHNQKTEELPASSKKEDGVENLLSLLKAEREKLQELENQYKKLGNNTLGEMDDSNNNDVDGNKMTESIPADVDDNPLQSIEMPAKADRSTETSNGYSIKDVSIKGGSSSAQLYMMDKKKSEVGKNNAINQKLEMLIKNVSQLDVAECYYKLCEYDNAVRMYKLLTPNDTSLDQYMWAQYQIANCYRNMKKYDIAFSEYQRFVNQFPDSDLIDQAKWYMDDINWWKSWYEKNTLTNNQLLTASNSIGSK